MTAKRRSATNPHPGGLTLGDTATRARILEGAARVFAEIGVQAASVEDILRAAGVARRTFYRVYDGKEGVVVELYRMGTDSLIGACAIAVNAGSTPLERVTGCIDAHLHNARDFGRLVFVLGGEAHRHDSLLHARRKEVHDALVGLFATAMAGHVRGPIDPLLVRALILAIEGLTRAVLEAGDEGRAVPGERLAEARRVLTHLARSSLGLD